MSNFDDCVIDEATDVFLSQIQLDDQYNDRFNHVSKEDDVADIMRAAKPKNTSKQETWALNIWKQWASCRNQDFDVMESDNYPIPTDLISTVNFDKLLFWLPKFILEVRNTDGLEYKPESLKQIIANINRHIKDNCGYNGVSLLDRKSSIAKLLEAKMKEMKKRGLGLTVNRADIVTDDDEVKLWSSNVFDLTTSKGLFNATFFYTGRALALRGREEHRDLCIEQFKFKKGKDNQEFVEFWPIMRKNQHDKVLFQQIRKEPIVHYDDNENDKSFYKILKMYVESLPEKTGPFYRKPLDGVVIKFSKQPVGINTLGNMLKNLFIAAGIDVESRRITNHGLRATAATSLLKCGFDQAIIKKRTGHRSDALESYLRNDVDTIKATSKCLDPQISTNVKPNDQQPSSCSSNDNSKSLSITIENGNKKIKIEISD